MATAQTIIDAALRKLGKLEPGESATPAESADCLIALNHLLESWRNDSLAVYQIVAQQRSVTAPATSVTVGSAGAWTIDRPLWVEWATWTENGDVSPIQVGVSEEEYNLLVISDSSGTPNRLCLAEAYPTATLKWYPTPANSGTLTIGVPAVLSNLATVSTSVSFPPGYERALVFNLALDLAPEYRVSPEARIVEAAREARAAIKRINTRVGVLGLDSALHSGRRTNIITGA